MGVKASSCGPVMVIVGVVKVPEIGTRNVGHQTIERVGYQVLSRVPVNDVPRVVSADGERRTGVVEGIAGRGRLGERRIIAPRYSEMVLRDRFYRDGLRRRHRNLDLKGSVGRPLQ